MQIINLKQGFLKIYRHILIFFEYRLTPNKTEPERRGSLDGLP